MDSDNIVGKGKNTDNQHFLLFPQCFLVLETEVRLLNNIVFVVCKSFQWEQG